MELMHPYIIYIGLPVILVLAIVTFGFSKKFKDGKKVANSEFIQDTKYYKYKVFEFKACRLVMVISLALAMSFLLFILARPFKTSKTVKEIHNRDIFLCLDTSGSMYEVDLEVCEKLKDFVKGLKGERFGITIFNCQTVTLVPLTTDYDYVIDVLDQIETSCKVALGIGGFDYYDDDYMEKYQYIIDGTITYDYDSGSSLIGDGLASTVFQFPDIQDDPDRARVIILATDNELWGVPFVDISEAFALCNKYKIIVFGAAPEYVVDYFEYADYCKETGGDIFTLSSPAMAYDLIDAVRATDTSIIYETDIQITEYPEKLVIGFAICMMIHFLVSRRIKL